MDEYVSNVEFATPRFLFTSFFKRMWMTSVDNAEITCKGKEDPEFKKWVFHYIVEFIKQEVMWNYCIRYGHKMQVVDAYAGPDTGYESFVCLRCNFEHDHIYY